MYILARIIQTKESLLPIKHSCLTTKKGDRISLLFPKGYPFVVGFLSIWASRCIAVPIFHKYPSSDIQYTLSDSETNLLLHAPIYSNQFNTKTQCVEYPLKHIDNPTNHNHDGLEYLTPEDDALLLYTSGTTARPKGVLMNHANLESWMSCLHRAWEWKDSDRILHVLPLHHAHGLVNGLLCALYAGACCEFHCESQSIWSRWKEKDPLTLFMAVPTIYTKLIQEYKGMSDTEQLKARNSCQSFRLMISGSSALSPSSFEAWKSITGHVLLERYGMTEIGMALSNPLHGKRIPGTVGFPLPFVETKLMESQTQKEILNANEPGELLIRGPQVFKEYWNKPLETKEAFIKDSQGVKWFRTGDICIRDDQHRFTILGRASVDIIKSGGYKISALEIEQVLQTHPSVHQVAIVGVKDEKWGQIVSAILVFSKDKSQMSLKEIQDWLADKLSNYKIPRKLLILNDIPKNAMGKVNKKELLKLF